MRLTRMYFSPHPRVRHRQRQEWKGWVRESVMEAKNLVKIDDTQPIETKNTQERTRKETFAHIAQGGGKQEKGSQVALARGKVWERWKKLNEWVGVESCWMIGRPRFKLMAHLRSQLKGFSESGMLSVKKKWGFKKLPQGEEIHKSQHMLIHMCIFKLLSKL